MLLLSLVAVPAHADQAYYVDCSPTWLAPYDGQRDVPTDARLLAGGCASGVTVTLIRPDADPIGLVAEAISDDLAGVWLPEALAPDTEYELAASSDGAEIARLRFRTGDGPADPVKDAPTFEVVRSEVVHDGTWGRRSGSAYTELLLEFALPPVAPDDLAVVVVEGPGPYDVTTLPGPFEEGAGWIDVSSTGPSRAAGEKLCVTVSVQDAAGSPSPGSTQCFLPQEESWRPTPFQGGCDVGGGVGGGAAAVLGAALIRRRRVRG